MNESHKNNVEQKKADVEYIYCMVPFIYSKRQKQKQTGKTNWRC